MAKWHFGLGWYYTHRSILSYLNMRQAFARKKLVFIVVVGVILSVFIFEPWNTTEYYGGIKGRYDPDDINEKIASEINQIFLSNTKRRKSRNVELKFDERPLKLLPNPNRAFNRIIADKPIVVNKRLILKKGASEVSDKSDSMQSDVGTKVLLFTERGPIQPPTADAPKFTAVLPQSWDVSDNRYVMTPWKAEKAFEALEITKDECFRPPEPRNTWGMITLVKSWVVNSDVRNAIRQTWGSVAMVDGVKLHVIFLVARASAQLQDNLKHENEVYGDILEVNIAETIRHFTVRTVAGMQWVADHIPSNYLYSSIDDNMMVNINKMIQSFTASVQNAPAIADEVCTAENVFPLFCGFSLRVKDRPARNPANPWSIEAEIYPPEYFPAHCQGGLYTTSVSTMRLIVDISTRTFPMHLDAVWITGILRQKLGLGPDSIRPTEAVEPSSALVKYLEHDISKTIVSMWRDFSEELSNRDVYMRQP